MRSPSAIATAAFTLAGLAAAHNNMTTAGTAIPSVVSTASDGSITTSPADSVNLFVDGSEDNEYAAAVRNACIGQTTYEIQCTRGADSSCGSDAPTMVLTVGPSTYRIESAVSKTLDGDVSTGTAAVTCDLQGTTAADCTSTMAVTAEGKSSSETRSLAFTGTDYHRFDVAVTKDAARASPTDACPTNFTNGAAGVKADRMAVGVVVAFVAGIASVLAW